MEERTQTSATIGGEKLTLDGQDASPAELEQARGTIAFLEGLVATLTVEEDAAQALHDIGQLKLHPLGDPAGALASLRAALARWPALHIARAYRKAALRAGSVEDELLALEAEGRAAASPAYGSPLETQRGTLLERVVGNLPAARQSYAQAAELNPGDLAAQSALLRLALKDNDADAAAARCRRIAEAVGDQRIKAELLAWSGRLLAAGGQWDAAVAAGVQAELHAPDAPSVRFLLERAYDATGRTSDLITLLKAQITDGSAPPAETWFEVGVLSRYQLGDLDAAAQAFEEVTRIADGASKQAALGELIDLWRRRGEWSRAEEAERACLPGEEHRLARAMAWTRIGLLREQNLDDPSGAADAYDRAIETLPSHVPALESGGRVYARRNDVERLVAMHRIEAAHAPSAAERAVALRRAGELLAGEAQRLDEAIELLQEAYAAAPEQAGVFVVLERALRRKGDPAALCGLYQTELGRVTDPSRRAWLLLQIGELAGEKLGDPKRAIAALREAVAIPESTAHLALTRLSQLLEDQGEAAELEAVLAQLTAMTADPGQLATLAERIALLQEQRGDVEAALRTYRAAVETAPATHSILASAGRAFARAERWDDLLAMYERTLAVATDELRALYGYKAGVLMARRLGRVEDGIARLLEVRASTPGHVPTLVALAGLFEEGQRWADLRPVLADLPPTPALRTRRAAIAEVTGHLEEALTLWQEAIDAGVTVAARPRARLLARLGRWSQLAEIHRAVQANGAGNRTIALARHRAAEIELERLEDRARASELLEAASATETESASLLWSLLRASNDEGPVLLRLIEQVRDPALCALWLRQLADRPGAGADEALTARVRLLGLQPRDPIVAVRVETELEQRRNRPALVALLRDVAQDPKTDPQLASVAMARVGSLLEELGSTREAADAFEASLNGPTPSYLARLALPRLYGVLDDQQQVSVALRGLADALPKGPERAIALRRLAAQHLVRNETGAALAALDEALQAHPLDFAALRDLAVLVDSVEPERLIDPLMRAFAAVGDSQRRDVGLVLAVRLVRAERLRPARNVLDRLLADDPGELRAWLLRAEVDALSASWPALVEALETIASNANADAPLRAEALRRKALAELDKLADLDAARATAVRLGELAPDDLQSLETRHAVAERGKDHRLAAELLSRLVAHAGVDDERRAALQLQLASVQEVELDDAAAAINTLGEIRLPSRRRNAVERLLDLGGRTNRWDLAASALEATLDRGGEMDPVWELAIRSRLANLLEGPLDRAPSAIRQYERIVAIDPAHVPARERLAELTAGSSPEKAIDHHRALLVAQPTRLTSLRALRQLFIRLGDEDGAFLTEALLEGVGVADEEESYFYTQRRARLRSQTDGVLNHEERALLAPESVAPAFALLHALTPALGAVFPVDYAGYGVEREDGVSGPAQAAAQRAARLFGVDAFRVLEVANRAGPCVEPGKPPVLLVPRNLGDATPREQACVLGELMARISFDAILGDSRRLAPISPTVLDHILWAACEQALPDTAAPQRGRPVYEDIKRRLAAAMTAETRAAVAAPAQRLLSEAPFGAETILQSMERIALRAAVFAAQDPALAIGSARAKAGSSRGLEALPAGLLAVVPFVVSSGHLALRKRMEIGVSA